MDIPSNPPNLISVAVVAAGGSEAVAQRLGVSYWAVNRWRRMGLMSPDHVVKLADLSHGIVSREALAEYVAECNAKAARRRVLRAVEAAAGA